MRFLKQWWFRRTHKHEWRVIARMQLVRREDDPLPIPATLERCWCGEMRARKHFTEGSEAISVQWCIEIDDNARQAVLAAEHEG